MGCGQTNTHFQLGCLTNSLTLCVDWCHLHVCLSMITPRPHIQTIAQCSKHQRQFKTLLCKSRVHARFYNMCKDTSKCMRWINWWICKSIPSGAPYVTLCLKIRWRKVKNMPVWLRTIVLVQHFFTVWWAWQGSVKLIWLMLHVSDWSILMIGPCGLLLVVSHLFAVTILVLWMGLGKKKKNWTWMSELFFAGSHTEHSWGCSKATTMK